MIEYTAPTKMFAATRRAQWAAVYWDQKGVHGSVIDWLCPQCNQAIHSDHTNLRRCPKCGLTVGETPIFKGSLPRSIRLDEWKQWFFAEVDDEPVESLRRHR